MPRVKRGTQHVKRRKNLLKRVKGYKWGRKNLIRLARPAMLHAGNLALNDRRKKKGEFRAIWNIKINAAARENGTTYSKLIGALAKAGIVVDRKIMATLADKYPAVFTKLVESTK